MKIILASASPARLQVLTNLGYDVKACPTGTDESGVSSNPGEAVAELAMRKLNAFRQTHPDCKHDVIACDTMIFFKGRMIGKPKDAEDARKQLRDFSDDTHLVYTGYAYRHGTELQNGFDMAEVAFLPLSDQQIEDYISSGEYRGAAGSYRIQGKASVFIRSINGDVDTVIGIPTQLLGLNRTSGSELKQ